MNIWFPKLAKSFCFWLFIPPNTIIYSFLAPSVITQVLWLLILHNFWEKGTYLILSHDFWSKRNRNISSRKGTFKFLHYSSFLPPTISKALLIGKKLIECPVRPHGAIPCYLILQNSTDWIFESLAVSFKYLNLLTSSSLVFFPPKKYMPS